MKQPAEKVNDPPVRDTIKLSELISRARCNSSSLPHLIEVNGERKRWVGIGWLDEGPADGTETLVIDE